jgi:hypothetical protein
MKTIDRFPYFTVQFNKAGAVHRPGEVEALTRHLAVAGATDLVVISHGWNNDMAEADALYEAFLTQADHLVAGGRPAGLGDRRFVVLGVLWPSKKFTDKELIPSGAAGVTGGLGTADLVEKLDQLADAFDAPDAAERIGRLKALLPRLEDSDAACRQFAEEARGLVAGGSADPEDASDAFRSMDAADLFERMSRPVSFVSEGASSEAGGGGAAGIGMSDGGAAGFMDFLSGALSGARNLLNYTTYYQMKERAGRVGAGGLNPVLRGIQAVHAGLRVHLVGHSFGGRLVTAAASAGGIRVASLSLLQAAFSHHGFSPDWNGRGDAGAFWGVLAGRVVAGPVVITCTVNDKAVGVAYPLASLLAGQNASGLGDKNSAYGGMGRNGAQKTPGTVETPMQAAGAGYQLEGGRIYNLGADRFVADHGDVANVNVVYAVLSAVAVAR